MTKASPRMCRLACLGVAAAALVLYAITLARTVTLVDSGEILLAARDLGMLHPPGTPLYVLVAHLFSLAPLGSVAVRVHALSAISAALASAVLCRSVLRLAPPNGALGFLPGIVAGLALASSLTLWSFATVAEVYALHLLLLAIVLDSLLARRPILASLSLGLALAVHHATALFALPGFLVLLLVTEGGSFLRSRRFLACVAAALLPLALYAYLPLRAAAQVFPNWGNPDSFERFLRHVTGWQYQVHLFSATAAEVRVELSQLLGLVFDQFSPLSLLFIAVGVVSLAAGRRGLAAALALVVAVDAVLTLNYPIGEDQDAYYLPSFLVLALALGVGTSCAIAWARERGRVALLLAAGVAAAVPVASAAWNWEADDRRAFTVARDYVRDTMAAVEPNGLLLTGDWMVYSPFLYLQRVEGFRPDVVAIDVALLRRSWYVEAVMREYPTLEDGTADAVAAFLRDVERFERGERPPTIQANYVAMVQALVRSHERHGPVYQTALLVDSNESLPIERVAVPTGLVFRLLPSIPERLLDSPPIDAKALSSPAALRDEVVRRRVRPVYARMASARGGYLADMGYTAEARASFRRALAIDPGLESARRALEALPR